MRSSMHDARFDRLARQIGRSSRRALLGGALTTLLGLSPLAPSYVEGKGKRKAKNGRGATNATTRQSPQIAAADAPIATSFDYPLAKPTGKIGYDRKNKELGTKKTCF